MPALTAGQIVRTLTLGIAVTMFLCFWVGGGFAIRHYVGHWTGTFFGQQMFLEISWDESAELIIPGQRTSQYHWEYDSKERRLHLLDQQTRLEKAWVTALADGTVTYTEATVIGKIPVTFHRLR